MDVPACFKALSDETRFSIFKHLKGKELCACQLLENFQITQPTLSFHMKKLIECGLVIGRKDGIWMRYRINDDAINQVRWVLEDLTEETVSACEGGCLK